MNHLRPLAATTALVFLCAACGPRAAVVVDDRERYVEEIADTVCLEKLDCDEIGEDAQFENVDDCHDSVESAVRDLWPEEACGDDRINGDIFLDCNDRARLGACDTSVGDLFTTLVECNAAEVCID